MDSKISVVLIFYNQEQYVDRCINSIMSQKTDFPIEILIGDDGSSDETYSKIKKWEEKFPETIVYTTVRDRRPDLKYNKGVRASENRLDLLKRVKTPYFIVLDGDDYWTDENKLQKQYDVLENDNYNECVGCAHRMRAYYEDNPEKSFLVPDSKIKSGLYPARKYWRDYYFAPPSILFRSDHIKDIRWDLIWESFNDWIITFSFIQFGSLYLMDDVMMDYCQTSNGIWAGGDMTDGIVRCLIAYDLELKINPDMKHETFTRHIHHFRYFCKYPNRFVGIDKEGVYLKLARKYACRTAERVLTKRQLFFDSIILDIFFIFLWRIRIKLDWIIYGIFEKTKLEKIK